MTTAPVQYGEHKRPSPGTPCGICATTEDRVVVEHCHAHGWVRGPACHSCNAAMALLDQARMPSAALIARVPLVALIDHAGRCPECPPIDSAQLQGPVQGPAVLRFVSMHLKADVRDELRQAAVRMTSPARRQLSLSEVLVAALAVARNHEDEWAQALRRES